MRDGNDSNGLEEATASFQSSKWTSSNIIPCAC